MVAVRGGVGLGEVRAALLVKKDFKNLILGSSQYCSRTWACPKRNRKTPWMMWSWLSWVVQEQANLVSAVIPLARCRVQKQWEIYWLVCKTWYNYIIVYCFSFAVFILEASDAVNCLFEEFIDSLRKITV